MTAYATTIYPAKLALHTMLDGHTWTAPAPTVTWGEPTENTDRRMSAVYQLVADVDEIPYPGLGSVGNDEEYALRVVCDVRQWGDNEQATEERCWQLVNEVLTLVRGDYTLGGSVNPGIQGYDVTPQTDPTTPKQWRARVMVTINIVGRVAA